MAFVAFAGNEKEALASFERRRKYEAMMLFARKASKTVYLSGGSDTRRGAYEYYREMFEPLGVPVQYFGWCVVIGGAPFEGAQS